MQNLHTHIIMYIIVQMKIHNGDHYCVYNKRFSSFALFQGKMTEDCSPYQISPKFQQRDHDDEHLSQLRTLLIDHPPGAGNQFYYKMVIIFII